MNTTIEVLRDRISERGLRPAERLAANLCIEAVELLNVGCIDAETVATAAWLLDKTNPSAWDGADWIGVLVGATAAEVVREKAKDIIRAAMSAGYRTLVISSARCYAGHLIDERKAKLSHQNSDK